MSFIYIAPLLLLVSIPLSGLLMMPYLVERTTVLEPLSENPAHQQKQVTKPRVEAIDYQQLTSHSVTTIGRQHRLDH